MSPALSTVQGRIARASVSTPPVVITQQFRLAHLGWEEEQNKTKQTKIGEEFPHNCVSTPFSEALCFCLFVCLFVVVLLLFVCVCVLLLLLLLGGSL